LKDKITQNHCKLLKDCIYILTGRRGIVAFTILLYRLTKIEEKENVVKLSSLVSEHLGKLMQGFSDKSSGMLLENLALSEY
jgi:hypothetical protein